MSKRGMVRLAIDFENPASEWWQGGGRELWEALLESFDRNDVVVDEHLALSWLAEAARLPGWDDGPDYAPHPVRIKAINEDEEV